MKALPIDHWLEQVGPGWQPIVKDCLEKLVAHDAVITQVKEKFGGLRVYYVLPAPNSTEKNYEYASATIRVAEMQCEVTCEECGAPGKIRDDQGWWRCLCDQHALATGKY